MAVVGTLKRTTMSLFLSSITRHSMVCDGAEAIAFGM